MACLQHGRTICSKAMRTEKCRNQIKRKNWTRIASVGPYRFFSLRITCQINYSLIVAISYGNSKETARVILAKVLEYI